MTMKHRPGNNAPTVPSNLAAYWEKHDVPVEIRLAEAKKQQGQRIVELVSFVRTGIRDNPHLASLLAIIAGADFDRELLDANAAKVVGDPIAMEVFVQIERIIAERTPVHIHDDLAALRAMVDDLEKSN